MRIVNLKLGMLETNCYIVWKDGIDEAVVIDPAYDFEKIDAKLKELGLVAKAVLITHCHFDHVGAVSYLQEKGAEVYGFEVSERDVRYACRTAAVMGRPIKPFTINHILCGGELLNIVGIDIKVLHTSGHCKGSLCYIIENNIFCGDTLFYGSYGRTDFPDGSDEQIYHSIVDVLFKLDGDYTLYSGHGQSSTLDFERENNMIWSLKC